MTHLKGEKHATYIQNMFGRIAHRYDLLNRLMTVGQDIHWRRFLIKKMGVGAGNTVLDLGAGTGDLALEIKQRHPDALVIASDFTPEMLVVGKRRKGADKIHWVIANAMHLPFASQTADVVVSGFLLRNVPDVDQTMEEQYRTLNPGGRVGSVDTSPPQDNWLKPFLQFHLHTVIPFLGRLVAGDAEAYTYLPDSTEQFRSAEKLADAFEAASFRSVGFVRRMLGTVGIHWGKKESSPNSE